MHENGNFNKNYIQNVMVELINATTVFSQMLLHMSIVYLPLQFN